MEEHEGVGVEHQLRADELLNTYTVLRNAAVIAHGDVKDINLVEVILVFCRIYLCYFLDA